MGMARQTAAFFRNLVFATALAIGLCPMQAFASFLDSPVPIASASAAVTLTLGQPAVAICIPDDAPCRWFAFTPETAGQYAFASNEEFGDPYGALYATSATDPSQLERLAEGDDDSGPRFNFLITSTLEAGKTYYLAVSSSFGDDPLYCEVTTYAYDPKNVALFEIERSYEGFFDDETIDPAALDIKAHDDVTGKTLKLGDGLAVAGYRALDEASGLYSIDLGLTPPKEAGSYRVDLAGASPYFGTTNVSFDIWGTKNLEDYQATPGCDEFFDDAVPQDLSSFGELTFTRRGEEVTLPADAYKLGAWKDFDGVDLGTPPSTPGMYSVQLDGIDPYTGFTSFSFRLRDSKNLGNYLVYKNGEEFFDVAEVERTGAPVSLNSLGVALVRDDDERQTTLAENQAFTAEWHRVSYHHIVVEPGEDPPEFTDEVLATAPRKNGCYYVKMKGLGQYTGSQEFSFEIVGRESSSPAVADRPTDADASVLLLDTGAQVTAAFAATKWLVFTPAADGAYTFASSGMGDPFAALYQVDPGDAGKLTRIDENDDGADPNFKIVRRLDAGKTYYLACSTGMLNGLDSYAVSVAIDDADRIDLSGAGLQIIGVEDSYAYTGDEICPPVCLSYDGTIAAPLVEGTDYVVTHSDNTVGPAATITVAGMGYYKGSLSKTFAVTDTPAQKAAVKLAESIAAARAIDTALLSADQKRALETAIARAQSVASSGGQNAEVLEAAVEELKAAAATAETQVAQAKRTAQDLAKALEALPATVTAADSDTVAGLRAAYESLTDAQKALVPASALAKLSAAEQQVAAAKAADETATEADAKKATSVTVNVKKVTATVVARAIKKAGTDTETVKTIILGKKVRKIAKSAFKKCKKVTRLVVKTKKLAKKTVKNCLKGSKVKTIQVKVGNKRANKRFVKIYKKILTKKIAGKKVTVR